MKSISRIEMRGLFHRYTLDWNLHDDVNILVGINGSGKSTILRCVDALLSHRHSYLKGLGVEITLGLSDGSQISSEAADVKGGPNLPHVYMATFDVPLRDKRSIKSNETPLDKDLQEVLYMVGSERKSFSTYRLKATNYPEQAEQINRRIAQLFEQINLLFAETGKTVEINKADNSLEFRNGDQMIPISRLSSGEKQLLLLLFTIFLMEEQSYIVLMDEPEISLHVGWQQQLIDVVRRLDPNTQIILATHSPSIFGEGWGDRLTFTDDLMQKEPC
ncbi:MAG: AAA family ATPase [Tannerella sp.]|jgi:predicted ATP-binding protein involved in virulence|nr:AAA family ATPase [Tannerella sp.]